MATVKSGDPGLKRFINSKYCSAEEFHSLAEAPQEDMITSINSVAKITICGLTISPP